MSRVGKGARDVPTSSGTLLSTSQTPLPTQSHLPKIAEKTLA